MTSCVIVLTMVSEIKRDEESPSGLQTFIDQGFNVARGLRSEAELAHGRGLTAQSSESKLINYEKSKIIELTADRIQGALSFLGQRLSGFRPDPEA